MNINKELNDIIIRFQLDKYYPGFKRKILGEKILDDWTKVLEYKNVLCVAGDREDINYFSQLYYNCGKNFSYCLYFEGKEKDKKNYDCIVIITKKYDESMINWCRQYCLPVIFIYDYLEMQGIYCEDELHKVIYTDYSNLFENDFPQKKGWKEVVIKEFQIQKDKFETADTLQFQLHYAHKLFFLSLYFRNFIQAEKYQKILVELGDVTVKEAWNEIQALLKEIKCILFDRKETDIVMLWMDAVSYGSGDDMPYLQEQIKKGICYENAFTVTPYTNSTAQTLFLGKKLIDDKLWLNKEIIETESQVLLDVKKHGYSFKVISGYLSIFEKKLQSECYHTLYTPCSAILWDMLNNLINSKQPGFILTHMLTEGHAPYLSTKTEEEDFNSDALMRHKGHLEMDEQMEYYMSFLGEKVVRIFMSDHGQRMFKEWFNTYFVVVGNKFRHRMAKELFSYEDFSKLIHEMLEGDALRQPLFDREFAEVQGLDLYNPEIIGRIIKNKKPIELTHLGYFGVVNKDYIYLKFHIGRECMMRWDCMKTGTNLLYIDKISNTSKLNYFRNIIGHKTFDINQYEKFKYSHYLYMLYDISEKKKEYVYNMVNQMFQKYSENSIALRMGGGHSLELFDILSTENKKKIACIIDNNKNCISCKLEIPVILESEILERNLKAVVLSSFKYLEVLRKEVKNYPSGIEIIDIYKNLENKGIVCDNSFYVCNYMTDEDYCVDFPFEELNNYLYS